MTVFRRPVLYSLALAVLVYVGLSVWGNLAALEEVFRTVRWQYLPLILALSLANYFIRFANWQFYLFSLGISSVPRWQSLRIFFAGFALTISPGKLGELIRPYLLKQQYGIPISKTASIVLVDRLTDTIALILIAGLGASQYHYGWGTLSILSLILGLLIFGLSWPKAARLSITWLSKLPGLGNRSQHLHSLYRSSATLLVPSRLVIIILISLLAWSCEAVGFFLTFKALGLNAGLYSALFIYAFSILLGAVSLLPGGLGFTEASMASLLTLMAVSKANATAATILIRVATLWFALIIGVVALLQVSGKEPPVPHA